MQISAGHCIGNFSGTTCRNMMIVHQADNASHQFVTMSVAVTLTVLGLALAEFSALYPSAESSPELAGLS